MPAQQILDPSSNVIPIRSRSALTTADVRAVIAADRPVKITDGAVRGLMLDVTSRTAASWTLRYQRHGRTRHLGLGSAFDVPLAQAREAAHRARAAIADGRDPLKERQTARTAALAQRPSKQLLRALIREYAGEWEMQRLYRKVGARGDDGKTKSVYRIKCSNRPCDKEFDIPAYLPPEQIEIQAEKARWHLGKDDNHDLCPLCFAARRPLKTALPIPPVLKLASDAGKTSTARVGVPPADETLPAQDFDSALLISMKLHDVYDKNAFRYQDGWNDERIAGDLNIPAALVKRARETTFGKSIDDEQTALANDVQATLTDANNITKALNAAYEKYRDEVERQHTKQRETLDKYESMLGELNRRTHSLDEKFDQLQRKSKVA